MQWVITLSLVAVAAIYVLWSLFRPMFSSIKEGCASGCGGCSRGAVTPVAGRRPLLVLADPNKIPS